MGFPTVKTVVIGFGVAVALSEVVNAIYIFYQKKLQNKAKLRISYSKSAVDEDSKIKKSDQKFQKGSETLNPDSNKSIKPKQHPGRLFVPVNDDDGKGRLIPRSANQWFRWIKCEPDFYKNKSEDELWNTALFFPEIFPDQEGSQTQRLIWYMKQAKVSLKIAIYISSFKPLERAVFDIVKKRTVEVRAITNTPRNVPQWKRNGVQIREKPKIVLSPHSTVNDELYLDQMHNKFIIVDDKAVITGSLNWTGSAVMENRENLLVTNDERIIPKFVEEFEKMWKFSEPPKRKKNQNQNNNKSMQKN